MKLNNAYSIEPYPKMRRWTRDAGTLARRKNITHGLLEVDVTKPRTLIRQHQERTGEKLSFTALIIFCLGQAIEKHKHTHAYLDWRNRLIIFEDVNVNTMVEVDASGIKIPVPHILKAVNKRSYRDIHEEIRSVQISPQKTQEIGFMRWFLVLPGFLRKLFYWFVVRMPQLSREFSSSVIVTAVGMFGHGSWWGIPMPVFTLTITLGSISEKPVVINGEIKIGEILHMTISIDHDIVDGAPAARFGNYLVELIENGYGLEGLAS